MLSKAREAREASPGQPSRPRGSLNEKFSSQEWGGGAGEQACSAVPTDAAGGIGSNIQLIERCCENEKVEGRFCPPSSTVPYSRVCNAVGEGSDGRDVLSAGRWGRREGRHEGRRRRPRSAIGRDIGYRLPMPGGCRGPRRLALREPVALDGASVSMGCLGVAPRGPAIESRPRGGVAESTGLEPTGRRQLGIQ